MMTKLGHIKCDNCGQYIGSEDIYSGKASNDLVYPDSHFTRETWESFCPKCLPKINERRYPGA